MKQVMTALKAIQDSLSPIAKDAINPFFDSKYVTLESVLEALKMPLDESGCVLTQIGNGDLLDTILYHLESGEQIVSSVKMPLEKQTPQGYGSAMTYIKRYSLCGLFKISTKDDDGNKADLNYQYDQFAAKANNSEQWQGLGIWLKKKKASAELMKRYNSDFQKWSKK